MRKCGYFSCFKGVISCKHPIYGDMYSKAYGNRLEFKCKSCMRELNGLYPSELPKVDFKSGKVEVIDYKKNIIN